MKRQPFTVDNGKVLSTSGEWWTPKELLLAAKECILNEPKRYDQNDWARGDEDENVCGTVMCIGGWMLFLAEGTAMADSNPLCKFLHDSREWPWLFECDWGSHFPEATGSQPTPEQAGRAIDTFIAEMEPIWALRGKR